MAACREDSIDEVLQRSAHKRENAVDVKCVVGTKQVIE